jgi:hypothetical protein
MRNEGVNRRSLAVTTIATIMLITATTTSMATTGNVFASNRNQATASTNDCGNGQMPTNVGCQNVDSQIQGDENTVALASKQIFPPIPAGFTVTGTGESQVILCGISGRGTNGELEFSAEEEREGTVTGTFNLQFLGGDGMMVNVDGTFTDGTTDGNTFTLSGEHSVVLCLPPVDPILFTISGDCGDGVTISYEDNQGITAQFIADVECTLT